MYVHHKNSVLCLRLSTSPCIIHRKPLFKVEASETEQVLQLVNSNLSSCRPSGTTINFTSNKLSSKLWAIAVR